MSGSGFAQELIQAADENHGRAMKRFIKSLVNDRAAGEEGLRVELHRWLQLFRKNAGVDPNDGAIVRRADAFGLVFAAGRLAQRYGIRPKEAKIGPSVMKCYSHHLAWLSCELPIAERLTALAQDARTVVLKGKARGQAEKVERASWLVRRRPDGDELLVRPEALRNAFPDYDHLRHQAPFAEHQIKEKGRVRVKRQVAGVDLGRIFAFRLPPDWGNADAMLVG
jgi:hypothetical protein